MTSSLNWSMRWDKSHNSRSSLDQGKSADPPSLHKLDPTPFGLDYFLTNFSVKRSVLPVTVLRPTS